MATFSMLEHVKNAMGLTGNSYVDGTIQEYIDEVREYLHDAGVPETVTNTPKCKGIITRGVADLWNYGSGGAALSPYFRERAAQLALKWQVIANE